MAKWQNSWRRENPPGGACWAHTADNHWPHSSSHHAEHASRSLSVITHLHHTQTLHPLRFPVQPWETPASSAPNGWHLRLLQKGKLGKRCFWDGWVCIPHTDWMFHIWWQNKCVFLSVFSFFFINPLWSSLCRDGSNRWRMRAARPVWRMAQSPPPPSKVPVADPHRTPYPVVIASTPPSG